MFPASTWTVITWSAVYLFGSSAKIQRYNATEIHRHRDTSHRCHNFASPSPHLPLQQRRQSCMAKTRHSSIRKTFSGAATPPPTFYTHTHTLTDCWLPSFLVLFSFLLFAWFLCFVLTCKNATQENYFPCFSSVCLAVSVAVSVDVAFMYLWNIFKCCGS